MSKNRRKRIAYMKVFVISRKVKTLERVQTSCEDGFRKESVQYRSSHGTLAPYKGRYVTAVTAEV